MPKIRLHFSFLVFTALVSIYGSGMILTFSAVCLIHEAGHIAAALLTGKRIAAVDITGFGIRMETERSSLSPLRDDLFILLAGPAVNIAAYLLFSGSFGAMNLAAALYNLLPYRQLDGGALTALFTEGTVYEIYAERLLTALKCGISLLLLIITLKTGFGTAPLLLASVMLLICDIR